LKGKAVRIYTTIRLACMTAALGLALNANAESFASSASSAGSASSGSVSDSLKGSSNSSSGDKKTAANGPYRIIDIAQAPDGAHMARVTMQGDEPAQRIVLDLPKSTFDQQHLGKGDVVYAQNRAFGIEFARNDNRQAFFLVLADDIYSELASRPVGI
jgi:hypothetical protein